MTTRRRKRYAHTAMSYAEDVVAGEIPACKWVRLACQRHIDDVARQETKAFPYYFHRPSAVRACAFLESLPHIKGEWAKHNETIELQPWQIFIIANVFGWLRCEDDLRRFRIVYLEMPRKNGKSTFSSGIGLYCLALDHESGAEVYSAATTRDQARIVWQVAHQMCGRLPGMRKALGIDLTAHAISQPGTASRFQALSSEGNSLDGLNIHCAIVDELHAHRTRTVYDVLETATGSRSQPLLWNITTAGADRAGICYEQRTYLTRILQGLNRDDTYFGIIYTIDEEDDWQSPDTWEKANPNYGVSVFPDDIKRLCDKAKKMSSAQSNFLTKRLSVWVNADMPLFNMSEWAKCATNLTLEDFEGERCWIGIDLAPRHDFCAMGILFERDGEYYFFCRHYLSEQEVRESPNASYSGWAEAGWIQTNAGSVTNYDDLEADLDDLSHRFEIIEVDFDRFQAHQFATRMIERGFPMIEIAANVRNLSEPTKKLDALIVEGKLHHEDNPLLAWEMSNVVGHYDRKENVYPVKERPENKIDGPMTLIMMLSRALVSAGEKPKEFQFFVLGDNA